MKVQIHLITVATSVLVITPSFFSISTTERKTVEDRLSEIRTKILRTQEEKDKKRQEQFEELEREIDSISGEPTSKSPANSFPASSASGKNVYEYKIGTLENRR